MSNVNFIIAQCLGVTATFILCLSYMVKNKKSFLLISLLGDVVYGISFIFVNSFGAGLIVLLSCVQNLFFYYYSKLGKQTPIAISITFILLFVISGVSTFNTLWDIIPIVTYIWFTIVLYFKDMKVIRLMYVLPNILLAIYDLMVMAYASAFEDGIEAIFLISIIIIDFIKSKKTSKVTNVYKNVKVIFEKQTQH